MKTLLSILKGIKNGFSTVFRKVKSSKRLQGALVLVCIVAVACGALFAAYKKGTKVNETIQETIVNYQDIEEITFQEATVPEIGVIHKPMELGKLEFDNPLTTSDYIFTYNAVIKAGYDLKILRMMVVMNQHKLLLLRCQKLQSLILIWMKNLMFNIGKVKRLQPMLE